MKKSPRETWTLDKVANVWENGTHVISKADKQDGGAWYVFRRFDFIRSANSVADAHTLAEAKRLAELDRHDAVVDLLNKVAHPLFSSERADAHRVIAEALG